MPHLKVVMVLRVPVISIIIWKYCILNSYYHPTTQQNESKTVQTNQSSHWKFERYYIHALVNGAAPINYRLKREVSNILHCQLGLTRYKVVWTKIFKKYLCNLNCHYEKYRQFLYAKVVIMCATKLTIFTVSKDERRTLVCKSMKNVHFSESQLLSQSVENSVQKSF